MAIKEESRGEFSATADEFLGKKITIPLIRKETEPHRIALLIMLPEFRRNNFKCSRCGRWFPKGKMAMGIKREGAGRHFITRLCGQCLLQGKTIEEWAADVVSQRKNKAWEGD